MPEYRGLRDFLSLLDERGELHRIQCVVDPVLEIAAITDRVGKSGGPALFFEKVAGHVVPVVTNLFGSTRRTAWGLGVEDIGDLAERFAWELAASTEADGIGKLRELVGREEWQPVVLPTGPCREVQMAKPDLGMLPAIKSWPSDGGRFVTLPLVFTRDPETGEPNCGMYRVQIIDGRTATINWGGASDGARHLRKYAVASRPMPVAIAIGGPPALIHAAGTPLPAGIDETAFAGFLSGRPLNLVQCSGADLAVPADAEFVIEGFVNPGEVLLEGPFGNHTGYYTAAAPAPVLRVTKVTHRRRPLYPCTVVGPPPMEDCYMAKATERLFLPWLQIDHPELVNIHMPMEGIFHGAALLSIRKEEANQGRRIIHSLWQTSLFARSRLLVVLDEDVDLRDPSQVYWRAINHLDGKEGIIVEDGRIGIDATRRSRGAQLEVPQAINEKVAKRWREYGLSIF